MRVKGFLCLAAAILLLSTCGLPCRCGDSTPPIAKGWRSAWIGLDNLDKVLHAAKELNFNAVISHGEGGKFKDFIAAAKSAGLESYWWFSPAAPAGSGDKFLQQMSLEEDELLKGQLALAKENKLWIDGSYQGGGEPLPGNNEVLLNNIPCFHCPEVVEATKIQVKNTLEENPDLTGIALDMFGYQNYRCCHCPVSMKLLESFRKQRPDLEEKKAREELSLKTLVDFQNVICDYARTVRPGVKTTVHVWPVYLPEPLYGNRLDLDYCCQTAAWFFKPYWSDEKIADYAQKIVGEANKYNKRQTGVPFIGYDSEKGPVGGKQGKSAERLEHELRVILQNDPDRSLSIFVFKSVAESPEAMEVFKKVFREFGIVK